jgi:hypothetical protein
MNGNGNGEVFYDYAQAWQEEPAPVYYPDYADIPASAYEPAEQSGGSFFGDLWKSVGDFSGSVLKAAGPVIGQTAGTVLARSVLGQPSPSFGPGQPALVGPRAPIGYPGIGGGGGGGLPGFAAPSGGGSFLSNPASLAAIGLGLLVVILMVRR